MNEKSEMKILSGSSNPDLAKRIASYLGVSLTPVKSKPFSDGEIYVQILDNIRGKDVYIIQSTNAPVNDNLMELLVMMDAAKRASAQSITAVIPFFGYARADRKDKPRISITAKLVANMLTTAGADRVITMDLHAAQIAGFFEIPCDNLFAAPVLMDYINGRAKNCVILSPDAGGIKRVEAFAESCGAGFGFVAKKRINEDRVEAKFIVGDVDGKDVLILDDMTESLGTLVAAAFAAKDNGAKSIRAAVTHSVLNNKGLWTVNNDEDMLGIFKELIVTNTTHQQEFYRSNIPVKVLDVSSLFAEAIRRTHTGDSVTELFEIKGF